MRSAETHWRRLTLLTLPVALLAAAAVLTRFSRVVVAGGSMSPTLAPGDRLLVRRGRDAEPGDLVVVRAPGGLEVVKRLAGRGGDLVDLGSGPVRLEIGEVAVLGDCPAASTDSRRWGPLPEGALRGRVLARYHQQGPARTTFNPRATPR